MSEFEPVQGEKLEKEQEKEREKEEKTWDEKWRRDPLRAAVLAACFIWAGLVLLAENLGMLAAFEGLEAWPIVLIGAGLIVLVAVVIRLLVPAYRRPVIGAALLAVLLLGSGIGELFHTEIVGPLMLIALGVIVLLRGFIRRA